MSQSTKSVRVSLDVSAVPDQPVGVGRFALDLVRTLRERGDVDLTLWSRRSDSNRWVGEARATDGEVGGGWTDVRAVAPTARPARLAWEQTVLPGLLKRAGVEVHHSPHYTMPERSRLPRVVTIHDLTFLDHPEWHERSKVPVFRRAIRVASQKAIALLCDSERTAARLEDLCAPKGRVVVIPLGVDLDRFRPAATDDDGSEDDGLLGAIGVTGPYVLFLGTLEPRKAVPELVAAFDRVADGHTDLRLVLAGRPAWGADAVTLAVARARHNDRVISTGYVPEPAVPALLRRAQAVAYPAKVEGFGLPALEALACGAPLVTTSSSVMSDLAGEAAITVPAGSVDDLAGALEAVVSSVGSGESERRREAGLAVAASHSWERCAAAHAEVYRWAAGRGGEAADAEDGGAGT